MASSWDASRWICVTSQGLSAALARPQPLALRSRDTCLLQGCQPPTPPHLSPWRLHHLSASQAGTTAFDRIAADCALGLYAAAHVNLTAEPTPEQVDYLAKAAVEAGGSARLAGLHSHPLLFRCPGPQALCLGMPRAAATLLAVGPGADAGIGAALARIADGEASAVDSPQHA